MLNDYRYIKNKSFFIHNTSENHFDLFESRFMSLQTNIGMATSTDIIFISTQLNLYQL